MNIATIVGGGSSSLRGFGAHVLTLRERSDSVKGSWGLGFGSWGLDNVGRWVGDIVLNETNHLT